MMRSRDGWWHAHLDAAAEARYGYLLDAVMDQSMIEEISSMTSAMVVTWGMGGGGVAMFAIVALWRR